MRSIPHYVTDKRALGDATFGAAELAGMRSIPDERPSERNDLVVAAEVPGAPGLKQLHGR